MGWVLHSGSQTELPWEATMALVAANAGAMTLAIADAPSPLADDLGLFRGHEGSGHMVFWFLSYFARYRCERNCAACAVAIATQTIAFNLQTVNKRPFCLDLFMSPFKVGVAQHSPRPRCPMEVRRCPGHCWHARGRFAGCSRCLVAEPELQRRPLARHPGHQQHLSH